MKNKAFIKGALILIVFNLVGKVVGALYRIPLAKTLGSVGMGQYQLTFPLYCLILTVATSGVPVAISKLVAEYNSKNRFKDSKKVLWISLLILTGVSLVGSTLVIVNAKLIAKWQGNVDSYICYYGIAPAILFVGMLSAFRGYFQGNLCMFPSAVSGLVEQVVKMISGLFFANRFLIFGTEWAVFGALLGVSFGEFFALLFLLVSYFFYSKIYKKTSEIKCEKTKFLARQLFNLSLPITLGGLVGPLTTMIDSFLVVNLLMVSGFSNADATALLGIQSGVVEPLVNIPVVIAVSISTALLPSISKLAGTNKHEEIKLLIEKAFQITLSISIACAICFVVFGEQALNFLYGSNFDQNDILIALKLLFIGSVNIVFLSLVQVSAGVLQGLGKTKIPMKSLIVGGVIKLVFDALLVRIQSINILGTVIAGGMCYFVVFALNFRQIKKLTEASLFKSYFKISLQECFVAGVAFVINFLCLKFWGASISLIVAGSAAVVVFFVSYYFLFLRKSDVVFDADNNLA